MTSHSAGDEVREFGPFRLRLVERLLERDGVIVRLGGRPLDLLVALTTRPGEVVSNEELVDQIWPQMFVDYARLRFHVAALRKALGDGVDGARYVTNVPGRGYCFVSPMERPSSPQEPPQAGLARQTPAVPPRIRRVVGRDSEVAAIAALLALRRFVTIVGPGGIGKTTVAISISHAHAADYGSVCFVDLGSLTDSNLAVSALAAALGVVANSDDLLPSLIAFLRGRRILLILDSCEHVIETVSGLAETIFEQAGEVHILATSRQALRIEGEQVHQLAPLDCPPASDTLTAAEALKFSGVQLFVDRASATSDRFVLLDAAAPALARICSKLDGIALAIELAAGRVDVYGVEGVEALLDSRLSLVWQGRRTAPPRHQTLNAALDWSYDLLSDLEQAVLRRLVVFAGPFALEAAQAVAQDDQVDGDLVVEVIASLVTKSLVMSGARPGKPRYRLLDTTCAYLRGKLAGSGEISLAARRHAEFFRNFLARIGTAAEPLSPSRGFSAYSEHLGNVRAALEWSFSDRGDVGIGTALAAAAAPLFLEMSLLPECRRWTERGLDALDAAAGDPRIEMELQASLGLAQMFTEGNGAAVLERLDRALDLAEQLGDLSSQLRLLGCLNQYHSRSGDFLRAVCLAERAVGVAREMADPWGLTVAEWSLGVCHHMAGNQSSAILYCRSALEHPTATMAPDYMRHGLDHRIRALCALARAQWLCGDADDAAQTVRYATSEAERIENPLSLSVALMCTAFVFLWIGNLSEAEAIIERLTAHTKQFSLTPYLAVAMGLRGELAVRRGEAARAIPILTECLQIMRSQRHGVLTSVVAGDLAEAQGMSGRLDEALATIEEAIADISNIDTSYDLPDILRLKGTLLARTGASNQAAAEVCFERSLALARRQGALGLELRTATAIARVRVGDGRFAAARDVLAPVYARFTQGLDTVDLRAARELLDACRNDNLPQKHGRMIGRREAAEEIARAVLAKRFVSVVGPGGVGKTTVATSVANSLLPTFEGNVLFLDLGQIDDAAFLPAALAAALGLPDQSGDATPALLMSLRDRRTLLILDGCEPIVAAAASLTERLFENSPETHILATSRETLRVDAEHVYRLEPLETPPETTGLTAAVAQSYAAVQLFMERASLADAGFELGDDDAPRLAEICRRLDGMPLAIELAAGRVQAYGIREMAELIDERFRPLLWGRQTALPRHQTLNATLDWSYHLLTDPERSMLRLLSIFVGGFQLDMVQAIAGEAPGSKSDIPHLVASLVAKSLVATETRGTGMTYRLLATTRAYAAAKQVEAGERQAAARRHAEYYREVLAEGSPLPLEGEKLSNLRAALEWCFAPSGDAALGVALTVQAAPLLLETSRQECLRWAERAVDVLDGAGVGSREEMILQSTLGQALMFASGNTDRACDAIRRGLALAEAQQDDFQQLRLLGGLHLHYLPIGDFPAALDYAQRAKTLADRLGGKAEMKAAASLLGVGYHLIGDHKAAHRYLTAALSSDHPSRPAHPNLFGFDHCSRARVALARSYWLQGYPDQAVGIAREGIAIAETRRDPVGLCMARIGAACVFLWRGDWESADENIELFTANAERHSLEPLRATGVCMRGELLVHQGDAKAGVVLLSDGLNALDRAHHQTLTAGFMTTLAEGMAADGNRRDALAQIEECIVWGEVNGQLGNLPNALRVKGDILAQFPSANRDDTERCYIRALGAARRQGARSWELRAANSLSDLWAQQGRSIEARELLHPLYAQITEGRDTCDLVKARTLLGLQAPCAAS